MEEPGPVRGEPAPGSLVLYGPGPRPWDEASRRFLEVAGAGGVVLPLSRILERTVLKSGRRGDLLAVLGSRLEDIADPERFAREAMTRLGEILSGLGGGAGPEVGAPGIPGAMREGNASAEKGASGGGLPARIRILVESAPDSPGVYRFVGRRGETLYVGKARSLRRRLQDHLREGEGQEIKRAGLVRGASDVRWEVAGSELEALLLEHRLLCENPSPLNIQRRAHRRRRGAWRSRSVLLILPSVGEGMREICLVNGAGRLHWERVRGEPRIPRETWRRVTGFLDGSFPGWAPGRAETPLSPSEAREFAEIALSWLAARDPGVTRIDLAGERGSRDLGRRLRSALAGDPSGDRVEFR